ncbi:MAG: biotin carboxylase N-terminal domain-containing protein, partial [Alphaproteobacteria bacterium]|nr:biotin carboxylase N-terminal domain-containing protein [Alphaproteobacteria bacterium]
MFKKILIANRGEISCRVIKTAKRMGITTVVVYSDADQNSLAVEEADEAIYIGPSPAIESYLDTNKILKAAKESGAEAVHPGYGFLSENASFPTMLRKNGITFIGPPPEVISVMGDKIESKKLANKAGVSTVPGHDGVIENHRVAAKVAASIGYPVMIKASSGGGGKGMRIAYEESQIIDSFRLAQS